MPSIMAQHLAKRCILQMPLDCRVTPTITGFAKMRQPVNLEALVTIGLTRSGGETLTLKTKSHAAFPSPALTIGAQITALVLVYQIIQTTSMQTLSLGMLASCQI